MTLKLVLDGASHLGAGVWSASLQPSDLARFATSSTPHAGAASVVLLPSLASPEPDTEPLSFEPGQARVLNLGASTRTIIVFGDEPPAEEDEDQILQHKYGPAVQHDDAVYLHDLATLPPELAVLGRTLLETMRTEFGGYFQRTRTGRFVNRPNNFWTVKIQPRDRSLRVTVRGAPHRFRQPSRLAVRPDRNGYSTFKLASPHELEDALAVLRVAGVNGGDDK